MTMYERGVPDVPEEDLARAERAVERDEVPSVVSSFGKAVGAEPEPDWEDLGALLAEIDAECGPVLAEDRAWARRVLGLEDNEVRAAARGEDASASEP